jgi:lipooligosaccharide transport system permease protein
MTSPTLRVAEANIRVYRQTWRGSVISSFAVPIFTLLAMGGGLGRLVDAGSGTGTGSYLGFVAPALLAATAMMTAVGESTYPVMAGIKWTKQYHAALATPIAPPDLVTGLVSFLGLRVLFNLLVYALLMVAMNAMELGPALAAMLPATVTGLAFAAPVIAWAATLEDDRALASFFRFVVMPLFLFSGTFYPVSQLPTWVQPIVWLSPLWHGIELSRGAAGIEGTPQFAWWIHLAFLLALFVVGLVTAMRNFTRRLWP